MTRAALAALLLLAAPAAARDGADWRAAKASGEPVSCVGIREIRETRVRDDSTIDFYLTGDRVYRNTLPQPCARLGFEQRFSYSTSLSRLCSVDIITVFSINPPLRGASCGLGEFQPVTAAPS